MSTETITQTQRLRKYLEDGNTITSLEALRKLGIARLSARVLDLKIAGLDVQGDFVEVTNQFGEKCRVKQYWIVEEVGA